MKSKYEKKNLLGWSKIDKHNMCHERIKNEAQKNNTKSQTYTYSGHVED